MQPEGLPVAIIRRVATTLTKILVHVTFSTKNRANLIATSIEPDLYAYIGGVCRARGSPLLAAGDTADHLHLLVNLGKTTAISELLLNIKRDSSKWLKSGPHRLNGFAWQEGYFAFSIGESGVAGVQRYLADQKAHHRAISFQDEVRMFLSKYAIEYDERHAWD